MKRRKPSRVARKFQHGTKADFLTAYRENPVIGKAAEQARISRRTVYDWFDADPDFLVAFREAQQEQIEKAELTLYNRGVHGTKRLLIQGGKPVEVKDPATGKRRYLYEVVHHDNLLVKWLESNARQKWGNRVTHEIDPQTVRALAAALAPAIQEALKQEIPDCCPTCKTDLRIKEAVGRKLMELSARFAQPAPAEAAS